MVLEIESAQQFFQLVKNKNPQALVVYKDWIKLVADWLEMIEDAFSPEIFTLTGGVHQERRHLLGGPQTGRTHTATSRNVAAVRKPALIGAAVLGFPKDPINDESKERKNRSFLFRLKIPLFLAKKVSF
jgi:predicted NBD/HSP70 family sugar kinase